MKEVFYKVLQVNKELLKDYHDSLGWFLTCQLDEGKLPDYVIYIGTRKMEKELEGIYHEKMTNKEAIEKYLNEQGIKVEEMEPPKGIIERTFAKLGFRRGGKVG
ncbi:MAG: hypothetical protein PHF44_01140 [Candidatus Pacebacteria bacterium]|nr:hypothetical protein [Candidatus Paceibacterota bacterium]